MRGIILFALFFSLSMAKPEGQVIFENSCLNCHQPGSKKPLSYLQKKYKGKPEEIKELAKVCPWGKGLSELEIELVSKWLSGE